MEMHETFKNAHGRNMGKYYTLSYENEKGKKEMIKAFGRLL